MRGSLPGYELLSTMEMSGEKNALGRTVRTFQAV